MKQLLILSLLLLLAGCSSSPPRSSDIAAPLIESPAQVTEQQTLQQLYAQHQQWDGTPYRLGGQSRSGIDCSAFVQTTFYDRFGIALPRTTGQQIHVGEQIAKAELQAGDLVFFRNGQHVGIYLEEDKFLHASTRLGVTISSMNNVYWSRKYWRSIRVKSPLTVR
jgi:cell wall-associated NlpC family hydrolase